MWVRRLHPDDRERVLAPVPRGVRGERAVRLRSTASSTTRDGRCGGATRDGRCPGPDGTTRFVRGFVLDITEQKLAEESLRRMRFYDQLTGLPNRVLLLRRLGRGLAEAASAGQPLALLILALDRFREIGNTLGHHNGDLIVRELAATTRGGPGRLATRWPACAGTSSECCCRTPTPLSPGRWRAGRSRCSRSPSWCRICPSRSRRAWAWQSLPSTGQRRSSSSVARTWRCRRPASSVAGPPSCTRRSTSPTSPLAWPCSASCVRPSRPTSCCSTTSRRWI